MMPDKVYESPATAIHDVFDGATIMFGGFASAGQIYIYRVTP